MPYGGEDFEGVGKLFNLSFSPDEKTLLSSGMDEFYLWDVATTKLIRHEEKNIGKATSIFNPNGNHIFSSDEDYWLYYYNINHQTGIKSKFWPSGDAMTQYQNADQNDTTGIISSKFIDDKDVLIFMVGVPDDFNYAVLIDPAGAVCLNHPDANGFICKTYPKEFLPLIAKANTDFNYRKTWPMLSDDYSRDEVIDTSPSAHILVIAMNAANGILVYKYDPQTQTLKQIWAPEVTWLNKL